MTPASKPEKSEWMQIAESDNASSNVRKVDKRLTLGTLISVGAIVIAGSLFANANEEQGAVADVTSVSTTPGATPLASTEGSTPTPVINSQPQSPKNSDSSAPSIAQLPTKGGGDDEFGEDDDGDHEPRERGERGEHRDRFEEHEDGDDD